MSKGCCGMGMVLSMVLGVDVCCWRVCLVWCLRVCGAGCGCVVFEGIWVCCVVHDA